MSDADCERLRALADEVALGVADGEDRAWALDHLATCAGCRADVERLSSLADELLMLAPSAEPPAGFEDRVAEQLAPEPRRRAWPRIAVPAVAALAAAAVTAAAVWVALDDDRDLADSYRETLAVANGEYFDAAHLNAPGGGHVGYVYGYQGRASWVFAVIYDGVEDGSYRLQVVTEAGDRLPLREVAVTEGHGSVGAVTPDIDYHDVAEVRLLDAHGREVADSKLHG